MQGLIEQAQKPVEDIERDVEPPEGEEAADGQMTPESVRSQMNIPDDLREAYERLVVAGSKVMFAPQTREMALKQMQSGQGDVAERLGNGIVALIAMLYQRSNKTLPPQILIPAGVDLLVQAADFLRQSGDEQITDKDIARAMEVFVTSLLQQSGADPAKLLNQLGDGEAPEAPEAEEEAEDEE